MQGLPAALAKTESTSLVLVVPPSRVDERRGASGRVVRVMVVGKDGAITSLGLDWCCGTRTQVTKEVSHPGKRPYRCKVTRNSEVGEGRTVRRMNK